MIASTSVMPACPLCWDPRPSARVLRGPAVTRPAGFAPILSQSRRPASICGRTAQLTGPSPGLNRRVAPPRSNERMRVGLFTDNDFSKVNGVTTTLRAVLRHLPADISARVYTADDLGREEASYVSLPAPGVGIPFYPEMRMYWPRFGAFL